MEQPERLLFIHVYPVVADYSGDFRVSRLLLRPQLVSSVHIFIDLRHFMTFCCSRDVMTVLILPQKISLFNYIRLLGRPRLCAMKL